MALFDDDEINKAMAEAEALLTVKNRALFKREFLKGYAEMRKLFSEGAVINGGLPDRLVYLHSLDLSNWSYLVGMLAGFFKWYPTRILILGGKADFSRNINNVPSSISSIKGLYAGCDAIGKEEARKILRGLILAWQKRIKNTVTMDPGLNKYYLEFLSGLKGL